MFIQRTTVCLCCVFQKPFQSERQSWVDFFCVIQHDCVVFLLLNNRKLCDVNYASTICLLKEYGSRGVSSLSEEQDASLNFTWYEFSLCCSRVKSKNRKEKQHSSIYHLHWQQTHTNTHRKGCKLRYLSPPLNKRVWSRHFIRFALQNHHILAKLNARILRPFDSQLLCCVSCHPLPTRSPSLPFQRLKMVVATWPLFSTVLITTEKSILQTVQVVTDG